MPLYSYKVLDASGKKLSGLVEAPNTEAAALVLRKRSYYIVDIWEKGKFASLRVLTNKFSTVGFTDIVDFTRQLATIINSGVPLTEALAILRLQTQNPRLSTVIGALIQNIEGGGSLSDSLGKFTSLFSPTYISLVRAGETSGKLDAMLLRLSDNLEKSREFRGRVKGAMLYPAFIVVGMLVVTAIMLIFVIPKLTEIYTGFGADLPAQTRFLIAISALVKNYWWGLIIALGFFGYIAMLWYRTDSGKKLVDRLLFALPVIGSLRKKIILVEFSRTLGILIASGVSLLDALSISSDAMDNRRFQEAIHDASEKVEKGSTLAEPLGQISFFPPIVSQMVATGEATGHLDDTLMKLSHYFEVEADEGLKGLTTVIEPLIMVVLGVGVGILVWSVIAPIYNLTGQIK